VAHGHVVSSVSEPARLAVRSCSPGILPCEQFIFDMQFCSAKTFIRKLSSAAGAFGGGLRQPTVCHRESRTHAGGIRMAVIENEKASRFPDAELKARAAWHYYV
ncbi:MAG: hypothetical protein E5V89_34300, partial [Mesorhizobium sp.]